MFKMISNLGSGLSVHRVAFSVTYNIYDFTFIFKPYLRDCLGPIKLIISTTRGIKLIEVVLLRRFTIEVVLLRRLHHGDGSATAASPWRWFLLRRLHHEGYNTKWLLLITVVTVYSTLSHPFRFFI